MNTTHDGLWPLDLTFNRTARQLEISFNDGGEFNLPFELLRVESPSAEVQGDRGDQKQIVPGKSQVNVERAKSQGNYAVRIVFDDGHDSGIFSWDYLYELGTNQEIIWANYLAALTAAGLTRS